MSTGWKVDMERVNELRTRFDLGDKTLTFEDGMAVAYAMAERMVDELDQCAVGDGDEEISEVADHLVDLTSFAAWVVDGTRLVVTNVTEVAVPKAVQAKTATKSKPKPKGKSVGGGKS